MQTRPIRQQKDKSTRIVSIALVISWLIIFVGVRWVFFGSNTTPQPTNIIEPVGMGDGNDLETEKETTYYMGEKILASGILTATDSFTTYTHDFVSDKGDIFGLKSKEIELYTFSGNVQLKGTIDDFKKDLPIILVTEIVGDTGDGQKGNKDIDANANYYLFKDEKIGFDLSISEGYTVARSEEQIHINDTTTDNTAVLKISPFTCTPGDSLRDCTALKSNFEQIGSDSFVSGNGVKFYNLSETITWVAFNPTGSHGYYLTPANEQEFASFANLMSFVDEGLFKQEVEKEVNTLCKNINYTMQSPSSFTYDYTTDGAVGVTVEEIAEDGTPLKCNLSLRLGNSMKVSAHGFTAGTGEIPPQDTENDTEKEENTDDEDTEEENTDDILEPEEEEQQAIIAPSTESELPANRSGAGWFHYSSVRGYDVYFSSKSISYAGNILATPKELAPGMTCAYKINVVNRPDAEEVSTNPDIIIYECTGSEINTDTLQTIGHVGGKVFVAEWFTDDLGDMSMIVE